MLGAITIDVDTLFSLFKRVGEDYDYADFEEGLSNFDLFLTRHNIKATFFVVGKDLENARNRRIVKRIAAKGHEIANHTYNHIQGFSNLSRQEKEEEIRTTEEIIHKTIGKRPRGFRAPGWNIDEETLSILEQREYLYDSSIFPSFLNPILKLLNYFSNKELSKRNRTALGKLSYMFSPIKPYKIRRNLVEIPIAVTPFARIPFFGTFAHVAGKKVFEKSFQMIKSCKHPVNYEFHLIEFVDINGSLLKHLPKQGIYVPPTAKIPIERRNDTSERIFETLKNNCDLLTLSQLAEKW